METVKVDIQKLQLLNDRIAQMIDALNQVRLSVQQGIQHSGVSPWGSPYGAYTTPQFLPYGVPPAAPPFASPFYGAQQGTPFYGGIQHTPFYGHTTSPFFGATTPFYATSQVSSPLGAWSMPYVGNGISHTTWDPSWQQSRPAWPFVTS